MPLAWIVDLPIVTLAEDDAHLYLWTTNTFLEEAHHVARAWGFTPRTVLTWDKPGLGPGPYVEIFTRRHRFFWDVWGNESANTPQMEAV